MVQLAWLTCPIEDTFERAATGILAKKLEGACDPAAAEPFRLGPGDRIRFVAQGE